MSEREPYEVWFWVTLLLAFLLAIAVAYMVPVILGQNLKISVYEKYNCEDARDVLFHGTITSAR